VRREILKAKERWSVFRWVTKNLLSRAPPCFGRHVKPLVTAGFAVVSTHPALGLHGLWPVLFMCDPYDMCSSSGGINRLMMMII
jgi:hypothetical protein